MPENTIIPFDAGQHQGIDKRLLPSGTFALLENGQLDRDGRIRSRPGFTALGTTPYGSGTVVLYDLVAYNDRLLALGDRVGVGFPTDLFELVQGGAAVWRPTVPDLGSNIRLPRATRVRDLGSPPEQEGGMNNFGCCASAGFVTLVYNANDASSAGYAHIFKADTDQTIDFERFVGASSGPHKNLRSVALSDRVILLGLTTTFSDISAQSFVYLTSEVFGGIVSGLAGATSINLFAATKIAGTDQFVTAVAFVNRNLVVKRFSNAMANVGTVYATKVTANSATSVSVEADSVSNTITVAVTQGGIVSIFSYNLTTGADLGVGPFQPASTTGKTAAKVALTRFSAANVGVCVDITSDTEPSIYYEEWLPATQVFGATGIIRDAQMGSTPIVHASEIVVAVRYGAANLHVGPNLLLSYDKSVAGNRVTPLIGKDLELAEAVATVSLPEVCLDSSSGKYYWANGVINAGEARPGSVTASTDALPVVTEFLLGSTARRQMAQLGNCLYIAGGCPVVFDGRQMFETGYHARARIVSITPSAGGGSLLPGAAYDYKLIWEALDSDRNIHRSAVSVITTVTMGATNNANTLVCATPHSMRCNAGVASSGGAVRAKAYRSLATVTRTAPAITGVKNVNPPAPLAGLQLQLFISSALGGTNFYTITFTGADVSSTVISATINAVTSARIIASDAGGAIKLTAVETGSDVNLWVYGGTANSALGLTDNSSAVGATRFTKGENFQLCAVGYISATSRTGSYLTLVDVLSDTDLASQELIYTSLASPQSDHAPPPHEYVWAGSERLQTSGQPKGDRWTVTKLLQPSAPACFAQEGILGFSNRTVGNIEASVVTGSSTVHFTRRKLWRVSGRGPESNGTGEFLAAEEIQSTGGLKSLGWRSIVDFTDGVAFQLADDKLYLLEGGQQPEWFGQPVRDTLALFPVITAAVHVAQRQALVFACQDTAGTTGALLVYDLRRKVWSQDPVGKVDALAEYNGRLVYLQGGVAFLEDLTPGVGTFVALTVTMGDFGTFGLLGWGSVQKCVVLGTYRGDCQLEVQISYNGGRTWVTLGNFAVTAAAGYTINDPVELEFVPAIQEVSRFSLRFLVTSASSNSEGMWLHALRLQHNTHKGTVRKGSAFTR